MFRKNYLESIVENHVHLLVDLYYRIWDDPFTLWSWNFLFLSIVTQLSLKQLSSNQRLLTNYTFRHNSRGSYTLTFAELRLRGGVVCSSVAVPFHCSVMRYTGNWWRTGLLDKCLPLQKGRFSRHVRKMLLCRSKIWPRGVTAFMQLPYLRFTTLHSSNRHLSNATGIRCMKVYCRLCWQQSIRRTSENKRWNTLNSISSNPAIAEWRRRNCEVLVKGWDYARCYNSHFEKHRVIFEC